MDKDRVERRIAMLHKSIEARSPAEERECRSGSIKISDAIVELMANLKRRWLISGNTNARSNASAFSDSDTFAANGSPERFVRTDAPFRAGLRRSFLHGGQEDPGCRR